MVSGAEISIIGLFLGVGLLVVAASIFWVWMLVHAITNKQLSDTDRIIWVLVVLFLHLLGALIYFFVGRTRQSAIST